MNSPDNDKTVQRFSSHDHIIQQPLIIKIAAYFFSFVFHPLFIPLYFTYYLLFIDLNYFNGVPNGEKVWVLLRVLVNMVFFPAISVFLLKGVGFIDSIFLKTQKDRIIPYIISNIFFFWIYLVFRHQDEIPLILTGFVFSVFITSSVALLANIYFKISMHAIGVGGLLGIMLVILFSKNFYPSVIPFAFTLFIAGIVCTSRFIISDHTQKDIYVGLLLGITGQIAGAIFIML